jgi:protein-disulfide isomerase
MLSVMSDKKIIIVALILACGLVVGGWIFSKNKPLPGPATISGSIETKIPGISLGDEKAPVIIEEYTNFLCGACANFALTTLPKIEENYIKTGKVRMIFYIFPPAEISRASYCANQAGKFLTYHNYLFQNQSQITKEQDVLDLAKTVGLGEEFDKCYNGEEAAKAAEDWLARGEEKEVTATPTFFINDEKIVGVQSYEEFEKVIEQKLK